MTDVVHAIHHDLAQLRADMIIRFDSVDGFIAAPNDRITVMERNATDALQECLNDRLNHVGTRIDATRDHLQGSLAQIQNVTTDLTHSLQQVQDNMNESQHHANDRLDGLDDRLQQLQGSIDASENHTRDNLHQLQVDLEHSVTQTSGHITQQIQGIIATSEEHISDSLQQARGDIAASQNHLDGNLHQIQVDLVGVLGQTRTDLTAHLNNRLNQVDDSLRQTQAGVVASRADLQGLRLETRAGCVLLCSLSTVR